MTKKFIKLLSLLFACTFFINCSRKTSSDSKQKNPSLLQTVENVSESSPLTYEMDKTDESRLLIFSAQKEVSRFDRVKKIISVGSKLYVLRYVPDENKMYWPAKLWMIECNSGKIWSFDYEIESFFADEDFIIINRFGNCIENYFYVDVVSAKDFSISASENLFTYLKSFPPNKIDSEIYEKSGAIQLQFSDVWGEVFANFSFDKSSMNWKGNDCNYSKDFWYIPTDAKFCEVNHYKAYPSWTLNNELKISLENNKLRIFKPLTNSEIYSKDSVLTYKPSKSKERLLIIGFEKESSKNIEVFDLVKKCLIKSFEASVSVICDEQISRLLYKGKSAQINEKLHYVDFEKNTDEIINLKKFIKEYESFVDFDFVSFKYPECELQFEDSDGLQYYAKLNLSTNNSEVLPANRYKQHDFSKYPSLH